MIRYFTTHPTAANLLMIVFLVMGLFAVPQLRRETFPSFTPDQVEVRVAYPGATAEDVENAICRRIEDAVDGINYVEEVRTEARENLGRVVIEMKEDGDFSTFLNDIKTEVEAISDFPDLAEDPIIRELGRTDNVVSLAVTGPMPVTDLKAYCENMKDRLQRLPQISLVTLNGFSDHQIQIQMQPDTLQQYGLSVTDIANAVSRQSVDLPIGTITTHEREILVRFADERKFPLELAELVVIAGDKGAEIRLGDIATIQDTFELDEAKILFDGQRAGLLVISKNESEDALNVFDAVKAFVEREKQTAPPGVRLILTQDISSIVRDRLLMLVTNGWQGLILVFVTMWLFFSFRFSFWVTMGLPVSFLGALFFLPHMDYSLNMLTMVGLLIALGLLMDDAIVISENVASHLAMGKSSMEAAIDGTNEVRAGVISSFLTTICVFGPISFLEGAMGKVLKVMPVVLILVLAVSLVEAFWILPAHLGHSLRHYRSDAVGKFRIWIDGWIQRCRDRVLGPIVAFSVRWRYLFAGLCIALFIVSVGMIPAGILKFQAFPDIDGDVVLARILLPQGTPLKRTEAVVRQLTDALDAVNRELTPRQPNGQSLVKTVCVQYNLNSDANETGPHVATVFADLLKAEVRNARIDDILNLWRAKTGTIPDVINLTFTEPMIGPAGRPIEIRLIDDNLSRLSRASLELQNYLKRFQGVFDITDDLRPGKPEIRIRLREGASTLGINAAMVANQLRAAFYGQTASEVQVGTESYEIIVRLDDAHRDSLDDLSYFHITLPDGSQVPIESVAVLEPGRGYAQIIGINGQRTVTVQGDIDTRVTNAAQIIGLFKREFMPTLLEKYPGMEVSVQGQSAESQKTGGSLRRGFLIGIIGIFILLSFQFKSYQEPLIVMLAIPLAAIGVVWGHLFMGLELCMPSVMGFVSLSGIVVNDSILLVEFIKIHRKKAMPVPQAVKEASRQRFRAILLTSMTTIAGLLPLLAEKSLQAQVLIPLATSIVFGIMASTLLILIALPAFYTILDDFGWTARVSHE